MKKNLFYSLLLIFLMCVSLLLSGCSSADAVSNEITINLGDEPYTIDPQLVFDATSMRVINAMFEGLVRSDENGEPVAGVASSWEVSDDGLTYTFYLREEAKWWDGTDVTAYHFRDGWLRAIDPQPQNHEPSYMGDLLFCIEGALEYAYGEGDKEDVAIVAEDEKTLSVTLQSPAPYFLSLISNSTFMPLNTDFYNDQPIENNTTTYALESETIIGNGPFEIASWDHQQGIVLKKNHSYWNSENIHLEKVNFKVITDNSAAFTAFKSGEIDVIDITHDRQKEQLKDSRFHLDNYDSGVTQYVSINNEDDVLKNRNIRKALAYSLDRKTLVEEIVGSSSKEALAFVNPIVRGKNRSFRNEAGNFFNDNDVKRAKCLLKTGLAQLGLTSLPELTLLVDDKETSKRDAQAFQDMWRENLGIEVEIQVMPFDAMTDRMMQKNYQLSLLMWAGDFNDPLAYLDIFSAHNPFNVAFYNNTDFDSLLARATSETDREKRIDMLIEAEEMVMEDMPIVPVYYLALDYAINPRVNGLVRGNSPIQDIDLYWTYIE
ncbi:peptide ABC transporter substrate-binding protein [Herbivorax sp. ANBcel31]|uniref:peptide ABC transporter substrate-binding protein n=1 Tax=Herbivorax sp. ANBcel31 TaxID=3069754 RepID=UPI0027AE46AD|nr:peptide ABC transporter substrate-binding protein [Herbivorax sp. ANBcel31]MDQ2085393.1 peptide ABC transporter substrate-binding protein [Herbivorax sp. ANBcel31]